MRQLEMTKDFKTPEWMPLRDSGPDVSVTVYLKITSDSDIGSDITSDTGVNVYYVPVFETAKRS